MDKAHSVSPLPPAAPAPDRAEAERASALLGRLAAMAMEQAEVMHQAVLAAVEAEDTAKVKAFGLAFDRAARGVRQTLAIEAHLARQRRDAATKATAEARARATEKTERRNRVARIVAHSICADQNLDFRTAAHLAHGMWDQLIETREIDEALALAEHPIEEIVLRLCREMAIKPQLVLLLDPDGPEARKPPRRYATDNYMPDDDDDVEEWWPNEGPERGRYWYRTRNPKHPGIFTGWYDMELGGPIEGLPWDQAPDPG
jgi:hypothetical protein